MPVEPPVVEDDDHQERGQAPEHGDHLERAGAPAAPEGEDPRRQRHPRAGEHPPEGEAPQRRHDVGEPAREEGLEVPPVVRHHPLDEGLEGEAERHAGGVALGQVGLAGAAGVRRCQVDHQRERGEREQDGPPPADRAPPGERDQAEAEQGAAGDAGGVRRGERGEAGGERPRTDGAAIAEAERVAEVGEGEESEAQAERVLADHRAELVRVDVGEREREGDPRRRARRAREGHQEAVGAEQEHAQIERADGDEGERVGQHRARDLEQDVEERGDALHAHGLEERAPGHGARLQHRIGLVAPELVPAEIEEGDGDDHHHEGRRAPGHGSPPGTEGDHRAPRTSTSLSTRWVGWVSRT